MADTGQTNEHQTFVIFFLTNHTLNLTWLSSLKMADVELSVCQQQQKQQQQQQQQQPQQQQQQEFVLKLLLTARLTINFEVEI